jgi:4-diphosphocytidyl-2-C-methyl-D-erythritol kinase
MELHDTGFAKLNLALHVRRRRSDGYHELETLFAFCADGDRLSAVAAEDISLQIVGPFAEELSAGADNLVIRAAQALRAHHNLSQGVAFCLEKSLPIASGIGGGSADAAASLRLCAKLWRLDLDAAALELFAARLGADVPACVRSQACVGRGLGDMLERYGDEEFSGAPILLINPIVACPTGPVFQAWDGVDRGALDVAQWRLARNDLETPACAIVPEIAAVLSALAAQPGVVVSRMSGSGATCFALFDSSDAREMAAEKIAARHPEWWILATQLRG